MAQYLLRQVLDRRLVEVARKTQSPPVGKRDCDHMNLVSEIASFNRRGEEKDSCVPYDESGEGLVPGVSPPRLAPTPEARVIIQLEF